MANSRDQAGHRPRGRAGCGCAPRAGDRQTGCGCSRDVGRRSRLSRQHAAHLRQVGYARRRHRATILWRSWSSRGAPSTMRMRSATLSTASRNEASRSRSLFGALAFGLVHEARHVISGPRHALGFIGHQASLPKGDHAADPDLPLYSQRRRCRPKIWPAHEILTSPAPSQAAHQCGGLRHRHIRPTCVLQRREALARARPASCACGRSPSIARRSGRTVPRSSVPARPRGFPASSRRSAGIVHR